MYEPLTDQQKKQINRLSCRALKVQGNAPKGDVLEIALVLDCSLEREYLCERSKELLVSLRSQGKPFLNLRLNLIKWRSDTEFIKYVSSYPEILMGRAADDKDITEADKHCDELMAQLKKFYARSRIIFLLTGGDYGCVDKEKTSESLMPFLNKKIISVYPNGSSAYPFKLPESIVPEVSDDTEASPDAAEASDSPEA